MSSKKSLSLEEHKEIGSKLNQIDIDLVHIAAELGNVYPLSAGYLQKINRMQKILTEIRSKLDIAVFHEFPELDYEDYHERMKIYFGLQHEEKP